MAPKKPNLTKSPKPNPDAARRFTKAGKHSKRETGKLFREFGASRILEFCAFAEKNAVSLANQDCKGGQNGHVDRAKRVETSWGSCKSKFNSFTQRPSRFRTQTSRYEKAKPRFLHKKSGKQSQKAQLFAAFVPLQIETQCLWQKLIAKAAKTLVGMTSFGT